jgi:hypothetical protein
MHWPSRWVTVHCSEINGTRVLHQVAVVQQDRVDCKLMILTSHRLGT